MNTCWEGFNTKTLEWMLEQISEFDARLIRMRFKDMKTPIKIANELNITKEDVTIFLKQGLKKLDTSEFIDIFKNGIPKEKKLDNNQEIDITD